MTTHTITNSTTVAWCIRTRVCCCSSVMTSAYLYVYILKNVNKTNMMHINTATTTKYCHSHLFNNITNA